MASQGRTGGTSRGPPAGARPRPGGRHQAQQRADRALVVADQGADGPAALAPRARPLQRQLVLARPAAQRRQEALARRGRELPVLQRVHPGGGVVGLEHPAPLVHRHHGLAQAAGRRHGVAHDGGAHAGAGAQPLLHHRRHGAGHRHPLRLRRVPGPDHVEGRHLLAGPRERRWARRRWSSPARRGRSARPRRSRWGAGRSGRCRRRWCRPPAPTSGPRARRRCRPAPRPPPGPRPPRGPSPRRPPARPGGRCRAGPCRGAAGWGGPARGPRRARTASPAPRRRAPGPAAAPGRPGRAAGCAARTGRSPGARRPARRGPRSAPRPGRGGAAAWCGLGMQPARRADYRPAPASLKGPRLRYRSLFAPPGALVSARRGGLAEAV